MTEEAADKLNHMFDSHGFILFFKKDGEYYGAGEDSRVVFAKLKNEDEDMGDGWDDEATFSAVNLKKLAQSDPSHHVFGKKDISKIKVVDRDDVVDALKDECGKSGPHDVGTIKIIKLSSLFSKDRDEAPNFHRTDEE